MSQLTVESTVLEVPATEVKESKGTKPSHTAHANPKLDNTFGSPTKSSLSSSEIKKNDDEKMMDEKEISELKRISFPLKSVNAGEDADDLAPMREIISNATVVALGESTHGTADFFKMKHRLLEYLVLEMGFSIFAIEANMPECQRINDYVLSGKGNLKDLIRGMIFWTWDTQEVFDMVEWMRVYNLTAGTKLKFTGFDMQFPELSAEIIKKDLLLADFKSDSINPHSIIDEINNARAIFRNPSVSGQERSEAYKKLMQNISLLQAEIKRNQKYLESKIGQAEYQWLVQNTNLLEQSAKRLTDFGYRDKAMAENVLWLTKQNPGAKIVLWAHNGHIHKEHYKECPFKPMGYYLAASLNDDYRTICFVTYGGNYTAVSDKTLRRDLVLIVPPKGSLEDSLKKVGHPIALINLHEAKAAESKCLKGEVGIRSIGAVEEESTSFLPYNLRNGYDGIIYIEKTTASQPIKYVQPTSLNLSEIKTEQPKQRASTIMASSSGSDNSNNNASETKVASSKQTSTTEKTGTLHDSFIQNALYLQKNLEDAKSDPKAAIRVGMYYQEQSSRSHGSESKTHLEQSIEHYKIALSLAKKQGNKKYETAARSFLNNLNKDDAGKDLPESSHKGKGVKSFPCEPPSP